MAVANLKKIDDKLKNIYENQVTVNNNQPFEDKSEILFAQMNFIAMANKQALHLIKHNLTPINFSPTNFLPAELRFCFLLC